MSKYKCNTCGQKAHFIDFFTAPQDTSPVTVYAFCKACNKEAWGGLRFHPEMNDVFNCFFTANYDYNPQDSEQMGRKIILQES